jgi:hypothetical protein
VDLCNSLALLVGRCSQVLLARLPDGARSETKDTTALLDSELVTGGLVSSQAQALVGVGGQLVSALTTGDTSAVHFVELLVGCVPGRPMLSKTARKYMPRIEASILASLLHHAGLTERAAALSKRCATFKGTGPAVLAQVKASEEFSLLEPQVRRLYKCIPSLLNLSQLQKSLANCRIQRSDLAAFVADLKIADVSKLVALNQGSTASEGIKHQDPRARLLHLLASSGMLIASDVSGSTFEVVVDFVVRRANFLLSLTPCLSAAALDRWLLPALTTLEDPKTLLKCISARKTWAEARIRSLDTLADLLGIALCIFSCMLFIILL